MNELKKLLEGKESYPPSEELWKGILAAIHQKKPQTDDEKILHLQEQMRREVNRYRPSLPEPNVARFLYNDKYYYLDPKGQIYEMDQDNPLVGNLVGEIKDGQVIIKNDRVMTIDKVKVAEKEMYGNKYYVDPERNVYKGFHPKHKLVYRMGVLNATNKIDLLS